MSVYFSVMYCGGKNNSNYNANRSYEAPWCYYPPKHSKFYFHVFTLGLRQWWNSSQFTEITSTTHTSVYQIELAVKLSDQNSPHETGYCQPCMGVKWTRLRGNVWTAGGKIFETWSVSLDWYMMRKSELRLDSYVTFGGGAWWVTHTMDVSWAYSGLEWIGGWERVVRWYQCSNWWGGVGGFDPPPPHLPVPSTSQKKILQGGQQKPPHLSLFNYVHNCVSSKAVFTKLNTIFQVTNHYSFWEFRF